MHEGEHYHRICRVEMNGFQESSVVYTVENVLCRGVSLGRAWYIVEQHDYPGDALNRESSHCQGSEPIKRIDGITRNRFEDWVREA